MSPTRIRWIKHVVAAVLIGGCLSMGWWQLQRATGGNLLSWAYTVEWPVFAVFVGIIWWRETRTETPETAGQEAAPPPPPKPRPPVAIAEGDTEVHEYNAMLEWLADHPGAHPADYRRSVS